MTPTAARVACAIAFATASVSAGAGAPVAEIGVGGGWDSNVFFATDDPRASASVLGELESGYGFESETTALDLSLDGRYQQYDDDDIDAATAIGGGARLSHEMEYASASLTVRWDDASSLIDAFDDDGRFVGDERRESLTASSRALVETSDTAGWAVGTDAERVRYHDTPDDVLREDYEFVTGDVRRQWASDERTIWGLGLVASVYTSEGAFIDNEVTTVGPMLSVQHELTPTTTIAADVSWRRSRSEYELFGLVDGDEDGDDYFGSGRIERQFERGYLSVEANRSVQPSSNGRQEIRDRATIAFGVELSERTRLRGSGTALRDRATADEDRNERRALASDVVIEHALGERTTLIAGFRYLWQDTDSADRDATGQSVILTLYRAFGSES